MESWRVEVNYETSQLGITAGKNRLCIEFPCVSLIILYISLSPRPCNSLDRVYNSLGRVWDKD